MSREENKGKITITRAQEVVKPPKGELASETIAIKMQGTVRSSIGKVFRLGDTVNVRIHGTDTQGFLTAFSIYPHSVAEGKDPAGVDGVAVNVHGHITQVLLRDILDANPDGPVARCDNLQCLLERSEESKKMDPLVDKLIEAGLFSVETTHYCEHGHNVFLIGPIMKSGHHLNVITVVADGKRRIPRLFYKSLSHGAWRVSPTLRYYGGHVAYDKGDALFFNTPGGDESSYTQATRIERELTRTLDKLLEKQKGANGGKGEFKPVDIFNLATFFNSGELKAQEEYDPYKLARQKDKTVKNRGVNTFFIETAEFDFFGDAEKKHAVDLYKILELCRHAENPKDFPKITGLRVGDLNRALDEDENLEKEFPGFVPDFFEKNIVVTYERRHPIAGKYTVEVYRTPHIKISDVNCRFEWEMAYDETGRVWIESISLIEPNIVNSYGVYCKFINSGLLTQKPFEYKDTVSWLKRGKHYKDCGEASYYDVTPLLDHLQPVRKFRVQRGIKRPSRLARLIDKILY